MKHNSKIGGVAQKIVSTAFFLVTFICLLYFYIKVKYLPFFLAATIIILPVVVNAFLHLFACKIPSKRPEKKTVEEGTKRIKRFFSRFCYIIKLCAYGISVAYNKIHRILQIIFVVLSFAGIQIFFAIMLSRLTAKYGKFSYLYPVVFVLLFVISIIIDKWIKHSEAKNQRTEAFFHNSRVTFYLTRVSLLLLAIATTIKLLGFAELQTYLFYALIGIFYYATAFILISLIVAFIKKQLTENPKIIVPLPFAGKDKNDLSVLSFLENNTGITMRGLWSMKLIKQIVPYTVIAVAAIFWLSTGIVQVESYQEGALYRFGVLQDETLKPGIHLTLPAPIDKVEFYNTQSISKVSVGYVAKDDTDNLWTETHGANEHILLLGDGKEAVSINLKVEYKINDLHAYVTKSGSPVSILEARAYELITQRVITTDLKTLLAIDKERFANDLENELKEKVKNDNIGLEVVDIRMESIHPPLGDAAKKYEEVITAEIAAREKVKNTQSLADVQIINAQTTKENLINAANAEYYTKVAAAESSVAEFMASVQADTASKDAYRYYKYLDALTQSYSNSTLILVGDGVDTTKFIFGGLYSGANNSGTTVNGSTANTNDGTQT